MGVFLQSLNLRTGKVGSFLPSRMNVNKKVILSIIAVICAFTVSCTSIEIPYWLTSESTVDNIPTYSYAGLWKECAEALGVTECLIFTDVKDFVNTTRGLLIAGLVMIGLGLLLEIKNAFDQSKKCVVNMCIVSLLIGAILQITGLIVFGCNISDSEVSFGSAFYLPILSSLFASIASYIVFRAKVTHIPNGYSPIDPICARTSV